MYTLHDCTLATHAISSAADGIAAFRDRSYRRLPSCSPMDVPAKANRVNKSCERNASVWKMACINGT